MLLSIGKGDVTMKEPIRYTGNEHFFVSYHERYINSMPHFHSHNQYEMYCLVSGTRTLFIDNTILSLKPGSVVIIAPNVLHKFVDASSDNMYSRLIFTYTPDSIVKSINTAKKLPTIFPESYCYYEELQDNKYFEYISTITKCLSKIEPLYDISIYASFLQLLVILNNESHIFPNLQKDSAVSKDLIEQVSIYISTHLEENLSLNTLADHFFVSPSYLSRLFKKTTSIHLSTFINEQKIQRAIYLMENDKIPINQVAKRSGFSCISSFNRTFKSITGSTPTEYKAKIRSSNPLNN